MKLKYEYEFVEIDNRYVAVAVGDNVDNRVGMIKMTKDSKEIFETIKESKDPNEVLEKLLTNHPEEDREKLSKQLCAFLNLLIKKGVLDPNA